MSEVSRRRFLTEAAVTAAGTTMLGSVVSGLARPAKAVAAAAIGPDPNFVAGEIIGQQSSSLFTVRDIDGAIRSIRTTSSSRLWKEGLFNTASLTTGDCLYATGEQEDEDVLAIERLWANISSFPAEIVSTGHAQLALRGRQGHVEPVRIVGLTEVHGPRGVVKGDASMLQVGTGVQVIQYHDPATGQATATRLISFTTEGEPAVEPAVSGSAVGLATWFCCGNVNSCGSGEGGNASCIGSGNGACGNCKANEKQLAWPLLTTGCGPYCPESGCCVSLPRLECGHEVAVLNPCNGKEDPHLHVADCGPTVHCVSNTTCESRSGVKFDLTPCAFAALGELHAGIIAANVKY